MFIAPDRLSNTQWELVSIDGVEIDRGLVNPIILEFGLRNQVRGYTGCNLVSGIFAFEDGTITIQSLSLVIPQQNCDSPYTPSQEMSYLHTLQTNSMYVDEEGNLRIIDNDGHVWVFGFSIFRSVPVVIATVEYFDTNYRLPHDAVITLSLEDLTDTNGSLVVISRQSIYADGMQFPLIFELPYVFEQVIEDHEYMVRVEISVNGELLFSTDEGYKVLTGSNPNTVHIEMHKMDART